MDSVAVQAAAVTMLDAVLPFPNLETVVSGGGFETVQSVLLGVALGALPFWALLVRARLLRSRERKSMAALLGEARQLDGVSPGGDGASDTEGLAADVSAAMTLSALRLQAQLAQERAFSAQAAHQLRTPLTALGLQIEELTMHPETSRQVRAELHRCRNEVDRLADVISDLLALARRGSLPASGYPTDPAVVAVHATHRWASSARAAGRELRVQGLLPHCRVPAPAGPASQVLDVLIDNALKHGAGDIEVSVKVLADTVRLRVADQGTAAPPARRQSPSAGEGIGLPLAEKLAAACGGQMIRVQHPTTAYELVLPRDSPALPAKATAAVHEARR